MVFASKGGLFPAISLVAALLGAVGVAHAELPLCNSATPNRLIVEIDGLRTTEGQLAITLYGDDPSRFLQRGGSLGVHRQSVEPPVSRVCIALSAPGTYALTVYQDVNHDGAFNRTIFSPTEPWGLSNDPPTFLGIPAYNRVKFATHAGENTIHIRMRFPKH